MIIEFESNGNINDQLDDIKVITLIDFRKWSIFSCIVLQSKRFVHCHSRSPLESSLWSNNALIKKISCYKLERCEQKQEETLQKMANKGTLICQRFFKAIRYSHFKKNVTLAISECRILNKVFFKLLSKYQAINSNINSNVYCRQLDSLNETFERIQKHLELVNTKSNNITRDQMTVFEISFSISCIQCYCITF